MSKVVRLPDVLADFFKQYPSVVTELVNQINDGALSLNVDVTGLHPVTATSTNIQAMIDDALRSKVLELRAEFEEHEEIYKSQCQKGFEAQIATFRDEMHEAIATAKKPLLSVMREKVLAA